MSTLVTNVPPLKVWVSKNALRDYEDQMGEWTLGFLCTVKSIPGRALYWEVYLPEYGALYDKLTVDALRTWEKEKPRAGSENEFCIEELEFWNAFDQGIVCIEKNLLGTMQVQAKLRSGKEVTGKYLFTLDNYHPHRDEPDYYFAEFPDEHKSFNVVELEESGHIVLLPNNRCRFTDPSLSYDSLKTPDFKVATRYVDVEYMPGWGRLGECDDWAWETPAEKDAFRHVEQCQVDKDICERDEEFVPDKVKKFGPDYEKGRDFGLHANWNPISYPLGQPKDDDPPRTGKEKQENPDWE